MSNRICAGRMYSHTWMTVPGQRDDHPNVYVVCVECGIHKPPILELANGEPPDEGFIGFDGHGLSYPFGTK